MIDFRRLDTLRSRIVHTKYKLEMTKELRGSAKSNLQKEVFNRAIIDNERRIFSIQKRIEEEHKTLGFKPISVLDIINNGYFTQEVYY